MLNSWQPLPNYFCAFKQTGKDRYTLIEQSVKYLCLGWYTLIEQSIHEFYS